MFKTSKMRALHDRKLLVIIGNGFDLDLELKTSYKDFVISSTFEKYRAKSHLSTNSFAHLNLFDYLQNQFDGNDKKWIDVEIELREFAKNVNLTEYDNKHQAIEYIKESFDQLRASLCEYLSKINYSFINIHSAAIETLKAVKRGRNCVIYNFNYTDIRHLDKYIGGTSLFTIHYIHGTLEEKSIVVGFENIPLRYPSLDFMIKYQCDNYNPPDDIRKDLEEAEEVLIFGHTLGCTDHSYFQEFFQRQLELKRDDRKKISIITFDAKSRRSVNREINEMTNNNADMLSINYIQTHGITSKEEIHSFFENLSKKISPNIDRSILTNIKPPTIISL